MQQFELLIDPVTGDDLETYTIEEYKLKNGEEILKTGFLYSKTSKILYPIINGVPILLTFRTPLSENFLKEYTNLLSKSELSEYSLPNLEPMKGEQSIQTTFTEEWGALGDDEITFAYDEDQGIALHKDVWLRMKDEELESKKMVLDVGCGFGKEAKYLATIFPNAKVVAIDLNLAVVRAGIDLLETGRIFPIVASLFKIPLKDSSFDHVHCQGVIHHTFSTEEGFYSIEKKVNKEGSIFIWVYAWEDSFGIGGVRGLLVHTYWFISHRIFRPILSRSPAFIRTPIIYLISILYHPFVMNRGINKGRNWKLENTVHGIRDMFTPMYADRLRFNEVLTWFEKMRYTVQVQSPLTYEKLFKHRLLGIGYLGRK
jgi:SAM-dependent methyltransferase/uncharacterized protein YbaR (Trm112 family)